ncbi:MAG: hypothetical protein IJT90_09305 [Bacteroidaceae bacterium]|nr:hypothetical protein [Bacteroidaceae bacterium]
MKRLYILIAALLMLGVRASWADVLTANVLAYDKNGEETVIKMKYEVLDESAKTCCIYGTYSERAIDPDNPSGPAHGTTQVVKGGSYDSYPRYMRIFDHNNGGNPTVVNQHIGFRLVISPRILKGH